MEGQVQQKKKKGENLSVYITINCIMIPSAAAAIPGQPDLGGLD